MRRALVVAALAGLLAVGCVRPPDDDRAAMAMPDLPPAPTGKGEYPPELASFRDAVEKTKLPYLRIDAHVEKGTPAAASKYRGEPYWPQAMPFPTDPDGEPLILLVQINFAEAPPLEGYPSDGVLQLFVSGAMSEQHVWGMPLYDARPYAPADAFAALRDDRHFRVVYHPAPLATAGLLAAAPQPGYEHFLPIIGEARLAFAPATEYVLIDDHRFAKTFGQDAYTLFATFGDREQEVGNRYLDFAHAWADAKIGGYASFVQGDPREAVPDEDWLLLLEVQSTYDPDGLDVMWGDAGVGGLFIRREDLAKRDFSDVAYYWDNH